MYNLAHLYFYEKPIENSNEESIKLLINSSNKDHYPSKFLLCIVSIFEFGNDIYNIIQELNKIEYISNELANSIRDIINYNQLYEISILKEKYDQYRDIDYIFDFDFFFSEFSKGIDFLKNGIRIKDENPKENHAKSIDSDFYEGFGN